MADPDPTCFEDKSLDNVLENYLYTDEGMFGEIVFDAQRELYKRTRPPAWAIGKKGLPRMAKEFWNEDGTKIGAAVDAEARKRAIAKLTDEDLHALGLDWIKDNMIDPATAFNIPLKAKYLVVQPKGHKSKVSNGKLAHKVPAKARKQGNGPRRKAYNTHIH